MEERKPGCCPADPGMGENCMLCGRPLVYFKEIKKLRCSICGKLCDANASCEDGHFVCDDCHSGGGAPILARLLVSREKDPIALYLDICSMAQVHMHGPENHSIIPCVLITAYHNNGGKIDFESCLNEAWNRGRKIPGGACGFLGVCGASVGAGIFASIVCEATPLSAQLWHIPQELTMKVLSRITELKGPRCCKRTGRLAIEAAAEHVRERYGIDMPLSSPACVFSPRNRECIAERCPYYKKTPVDR